MIIQVDESPVGIGKTERAIRRAVTFPARWLIAVERLESIDELRQRIIAMMASSHASPSVVSIRSDEGQRGFSVRQDIEALPSQYGYAEHIIVLCTHSALLMSDLRGFRDWHLIIDEVPDVLALKDVCSKLDRDFFQTHFTLTRVLDCWSEVGLTEAGRNITGSDLDQDDSHRHLRLFHRRVVDSERIADRHVLCNLTDWQEMRQSNLKWTWWSLFSARELEAFDSVLCLGNGFTKSFTAKLIRQWDPDVVWEPFSTQAERELVSRHVTVRYFSERLASKTFFESKKGERVLAQIGSHIASAVSMGRFIWSSNLSCAHSLERHLGQRTRLSPKQAGSDRWMHTTHAAMIYAAKPSPSVRAILECLGVAEKEWIDSNEREVILQFVTRTSIRDVASSKDVVVYVFDRAQAHYLMEFFDGQPHIEAYCEFVDLGLDLSREKSGPKPKSLTPEEVEAKNARRRASKAASERRRRAQRKAA